MVKFYLLLLNICPWERARKVRWCKCFYLTHQRTCLTAVELKGKFPVKLQMFNGKICTLWTRSNFCLMFLLWNQWWRCYWFQESLLRNLSLLEVPGGNLRVEFCLQHTRSFLFIYGDYMDSTGARTWMQSRGHSQQSFYERENCLFWLQYSPAYPSTSSLPTSLAIQRYLNQLATVTFLFGSDRPRRSYFSLSFEAFLIL